MKKLETTNGVPLKKGDFVRTADGYIAILKDISSETDRFVYSAYRVSETIFWGESELAPPTRIADQEEKKTFLFDLRKKGLKWDPEKNIVKERLWSRLFCKSSFLGEKLKVR